MVECLASIQKGLSLGPAALKTIKYKPGIHKSKHSYNKQTNNGTQPQCGRHLLILFSALTTACSSTAFPVPDPSRLLCTPTCHISTLDFTDPAPLSEHSPFYLVPITFGSEQRYSFLRESLQTPHQGYRLVNTLFRYTNGK